MKLPPMSERRPFNVACSACKHVWAIAYLPMPLGDAARILSKATCPNCAAGVDQIRCMATPGAPEART